MKRKLKSMLLLCTIAFSSSYAFAENLNVKGEHQEADKESTENNLDTEEERREKEYLEIIEDLGLETNDTDKIQSEAAFVDEIALTLGSKTVSFNGYAITLHTAPTVVDSKTYLPLRFIVEDILKAELEWNATTKTAKVSKDEQKVVITINNKVAYVNGVPVTLDAPAIVKEGTTMLPLRFIADVFGIDTNYNMNTKQITLRVGYDTPNTAPSAKFYFSTSTYTVGREIEVVDISSDIDQDKIIAREWQVSGDMSAYGSDIKKIFNKPKEGNYTVGLRVRDARGLWSDWYTQEVTVEPNKAPEITLLEPSKKSYAQGEEINLVYKYHNEIWEEVTNEKWTYRHAEDPESKAILGKPKVLFTKGEYIVSLELDDAAGNRSKKFETTISITDEVLKSELSYRFTQGSIGEIIDNYEKVNYRDYKDTYVVSKSTVAGTMIMSDSPEVVSRDGILYRDAINGKGRILMHHLNGYDAESYSGDNRRLVLIAQNTSAKDVTLTVSNKSIKGPATDILRIGQLVLTDYLKGREPETYTLKPGERVYLYDSKLSKWLNGQCISGLMDIETSGELTFTTASVKHGVTIDNMVGMELLSKDIHPRGTFDTVQINYNIFLDENEPTKLLIGTGTEEWVNGYDAITGEIVQNRGNFGITYKMTITATQDMGIILNPRATNFRGAIRWDNDPKKVYYIPKSGEFAADTTKAAVLGVIKAGETRTLEYMLPNGSSAPVLIGFIPRSQWNN